MDIMSGQFARAVRETDAVGIATETRVPSEVVHAIVTAGAFSADSDAWRPSEPAASHSRMPLRHERRRALSPIEMCRTSSVSSARDGDVWFSATRASSRPLVTVRWDERLATRCRPKEKERRDLRPRERPVSQGRRR